jgi:hypothetical protein
LTSFLGLLVDRMRRSPTLRRLRDTPLGAHLAWRLTGLRARADGYEAARLARFDARRALYAPAPEAGPFSLLTPVWNTDPGYLRALADSVFAQEGAPEIEWLIHDNASSDPATIAALAEIARHPIVKLERSATNLGIIGGLRACLVRASGRYLVPLDHDDWLYPDALRVVARCLADQNFPALLYTDEDKLYGAAHCLPFAKPDWDPVLFVNAAYIAHLHVLDRQRALALDLWNDRAFEGCHDWDSFARFWQAGHTPGHAREIVYGWRIHPGSTAGSARAKDFIETSQQALLQRFIAGRAAPERYALERNPRFPGTPNWHIRRLPVAPRPVVTIVLGGADDAAIAQWRAATRYPDHRWIDVPDLYANALAPLIAPAREAAAAGALVRLLHPGVAPAADADAMLWEAVGLFELFPDTAMVGGRILDGAGRIRTARAYFGHGHACDSPDAGLPADDPGYQALLWQQQSVSAVSAGHAVIDPELLRATLAAHPGLPLTAEFLGAWCGAQARRTRRRVVYSPFLVAVAPSEPDPLRVTRAESLMFAERHGDLIPDAALRSPRLAELGI